MASLSPVSTGGVLGSLELGPGTGSNWETSAAMTADSACSARTVFESLVLSTRELSCRSSDVVVMPGLLFGGEWARATIGRLVGDGLEPCVAAASISRSDCSAV